MQATSQTLQNLGVVRPTLVLDEERLQQNIDRMVKRAQQNDVVFRPHFKTHQSAAIGEYFRTAGATKITVSSWHMATYFADHGWTDITVAIPVNLLQMATINELAERITLNLAVDSVAAVDALKEQVRHPVNIWIEADIGYHRSGVWYENVDDYVNLADMIADSDKLTLKGMLTHAGHSYKAYTKEQIAAVHEESVGRLAQLRTQLLVQGHQVMISIGDTPTCSVLDDLSAVDEMRPGNFVFYDLTMVDIGVCEPADIAVAVACPVIGTYPHRQQVIVHGGGVHFSKDVLSDGDRSLYGRVIRVRNGAFAEVVEGIELIGLSQEHGTLQLSDPALLDELVIGDLLLIVPVHSCMTADLYSSYLDLQGRRYPRIPRQP